MDFKKMRTWAEVKIDNFKNKTLVTKGSDRRKG